MAWKHFPHYCPFVMGIHGSPVDSVMRRFLCFPRCQSEQAVEQTVDLPAIFSQSRALTNEWKRYLAREIDLSVVWNAMTLTWRWPLSGTCGCALQTGATWCCRVPWPNRVPSQTPGDLLEPYLIRPIISCHLGYHALKIAWVGHNVATHTMIQTVSEWTMYRMANLANWWKPRVVMMPIFCR